ADALEIHPSTATRLCDRLAGKNLIHRESSVESRREVTVSLAPAGLQLLHSVTRRRRAEIERIVERMPAESYEQMIAAFESFAEAAGELPDSAWRLGWAT
ncbi:MAG TPA: MarR family transcriptional regulator, partial [Acidimicrobiales bacterium]